MTCPLSGGGRPRFPCPQVPALVWDSQGLRKAQFTTFPQWWPLNDSLPLLLFFSSRLFSRAFSLCPCCCQAAVLEAAQRFLGRFVEEEGDKKQEYEEEGTHGSLGLPCMAAALFPIQDAPSHSHSQTTGSSQSWKILPMSSAALRKSLNMGSLV